MIYSLRGPRADSKSGIPGVCWRESRQKWIVKCDGIYVGQFDQLEDAIRKREKFVEKFHGEFAYRPQETEGA